ncbi:MAG: 2TM domain-containing protein [Weeksellaceae bacterium]|nr:2TM domain-containing protein [Bacteroidota bacterium]MCG2779919.1 2TM domain-containing protein [Weeksellaceae bacterium]
METNNENDIRYLQAKRRVKRMKGFYIHATVYVLVNLFIIAGNTQEGESILNMDNYWTAIFWGIGLLAHGISVFVPNIFLGKDWEERKIRELMDKYK